MKVVAAVIQEAPIFLNLNASLARAQTLIAEAARDGARVIAFPETWLTGYPVWLDLAPGSATWDHPGAKALYRKLWQESPEWNDQAMQLLADTARKHNVWLIMGAHERLGGTLYNAIFYFTPEGDASVHRKLTPTYNEKLIWGQGDGSTLTHLQTPFGVLGGLICWEHWMPLARAAMHAAREVIHVAQWPAVGDLHQLASRHYAFEGACFVLAAGCVLTRDEVIAAVPDGPGAALLAQIPQDQTFLRNGGGAIIGPDSNYIVAPKEGSSETLIATLDLDACIDARLTLDVNGHYARPDVFQLTVNSKPQENVRFE